MSGELTEREMGINLDRTVREEESAIATVAEPDTTVREMLAGSEGVEASTVREIPDKVWGEAGTVGESGERHGATVREENATVVESVHSTLREPNATLREGAHGGFSGVIRGDAPRVNLPERVERDYEWVRDIDVASGESDVSIIRNRQTREECFFKHYHKGKTPEGQVIELLMNDASSDHTVRIYGYSSDADDAWEIQEYCPLGTLGNGIWATQHEKPLDDGALMSILDEVSSAIHHVHGMDIAHRDIKPSNILVKQAEPLNLVLTDFGIARDDQAVTHRTTFAGTNFYAAPEAHEERSSKHSDWFALGAILFELLMGFPLLASKPGETPSASKARANCLERKYYSNVDSIEDDRWRLLIQGLVTDERKFRWGYDQVKAWQNGEQPEVYWVTRGSFAGISPEQCYQPPWSRDLLAAPDQLAQSLGEHWGEARRALVGREKAKIKSFLSMFPGSESAIKVLDGDESLEQKLLRLQLMLDAGSPPRFEGCLLDTVSIRSQIESAQKGNQDSCDWLLSVVAHDALIIFSEHTKDGKTAQAGRLLKTWYDQVEDVKKRIPDSKHDIANNAFKSALAELFVKAYDSEESR